MARAVSGIAMEWARRIAVDKQLSPTARDVLVSGIAYHANYRTGRSWTSADHLAGELDVCERTIRRAWDEIEKAGILELAKVRRKGRTPTWILPAEARWAPPERTRSSSRTDTPATRTDTSVHENGHRSPTNKGVTSEQARGERSTWRDERGYVYVGDEP